MKQTLKKFMSIAFMMICVLAFTACGASAETEDNGVDETLSANMITTAEGLSEAIVALSDEDIASYKESGDAFTELAMEAWETNRDELGEFKSMGSAVAEEITEGYSVTVPMEFSLRNGELIYTFDEEGMPTGLAVNPEYTLAENMKRAGMNTLMGVGIVFVMLIFLSFLISLFKFIPALEAKMTKKEEKAPAAPAKKAAAPAPAPAAPVVQETDDSELVAVIAAAIAAAEGTTTDGFVVRSIKKVNRKKW